MSLCLHKRCQKVTTRSKSITYITFISMNTTDKMGGYVRARIIETKYIDTFVIIGKRAKITLKPESEFLELDAKKYGISPIISPAREKSGHIFEINISISLKNPIDQIFHPFNKVIAVLTDPLGNNTVYGTRSYPLSASSAPIVSDRASGETGELISLIGRQPLSVLTLQQ